MALSAIDDALNIICAPYLSRHVLAADLYPRGRFLAAPGVVDLVCGQLDDRAVLTYAQEGGKDYRAAQVLCRAAHLTAKAPEGMESDYPPLRRVQACRAKLIEIGFLGVDELSLWALKSYHTIIIGYRPETDLELFDALAALGVTEGEGRGHYELHQAEEIPGLAARGADSPFAVQIFQSARDEVIFGLSHVRGLVDDLEAEDSSFRGITICCPSNYNGLLSQCESMFGLRLSLPLGVACDLPCFRDFIAGVRASDLTDGEALARLGGQLDELGEKGEGFRRTAVTLMDALSLARSVQERTPLGDELLHQYLRATISTALDLETKAAQSVARIRVVNSFASAAQTSSRHLVFLGFNDDLIASAIDSDIIPDALKRKYGYARTSVQNNASLQEQVRFVLSQCSSLYLSRSEGSTTSNFGPAFFVATGAPWIVERPVAALRTPAESEMESWAASAPTYISHSISHADGSVARPDLEVLSSFGQDLYRRTLSYQPFTDAIVRADPVSAGLFDSYDPRFSSDVETVEYLRQRYALPDQPKEGAKSINLSYSTIELYTQNPFNFYCQKVLGISGGDSLASLQGTYLHKALERGREFDPVAAKAETLKDVIFPLEGMGKEEVSFFMDRALANYEAGIKEPLTDLIEELGISYIKPAKGDEFELQRFPLDAGASFTLKADAIFQARPALSGDVEPQGAIIVDFKKNSDISKKVSLTKAAVGEVLQLPMYCLFFAALCDAAENRDQLLFLKDKLLGAYIVTMQRNWRESKQTIMGGLTIREWIPVVLEGFKAMYLSGKALQGQDFLTLDARFESLLADGSPEIYRPFATAEDIEKRFGGDNPGFIESIKSAVLIISQVLYYLRHGRLRSADGTECVWFPDYPLVDNSDHAKSFNSYPDISFLGEEDRPVRKYKTGSQKDDWHLSFGDSDANEAADGALVSTYEDDEEDE